MREPGIPRPRVALVSVGIGRVQRGFERYFSELFELLRGEIPMTLFRSAGGGPGEVVPPLLGPATTVARRAPLGWLAGHAEYNRDCLAFAATMLPRLLRERFDVVHCIDPPMAYALAHARRLSLLRSRVLFTEGSVMPPSYYPRVDHIHHVAHAAHAAALAHGVAPEGMTLVPCGLRVERFPLLDDAPALRARFGIAPSTFVVLAVSAIKRVHKRVDHVVAEFARLEGDVMLWIDGNPEDDELVARSRERLGSRLRITHVASAEVATLYRAADVLVHAALEESFGLAIVEAACSGAPVLVHDAPHFEWLLGGRARLVDMKAEGALASRLEAVRANREAERAAARSGAGDIRRRFDWNALAPQYLGMYARVSGKHVEIGGALEERR